MTPDARPHWSHRLPQSLRPYASLARWDRPVGYWLLALPGWIGIAFALMSWEAEWGHAGLALLILIGAVAMRGAGCTYNDIVDRELDAKVERTRARPLPSGAVSVRQAWIWLVAQCLVGLVALLSLPNTLSQITALASMPLVAAYPFMKRLTWWPQVWLGLTFNWAALVAFAAVTGHLQPPIWALYAGLAAWTVGYDTIYALQDIEDDAVVGIRSTARKFGSRVRAGVAVSYGLAFLLVWLAVWEWLIGSIMNISNPADPYAEGERALWALAIVAPFALDLTWQVARLRREDDALALQLFKSNGWAGLILAVTMVSYGVYVSLTT